MNLKSLNIDLFYYINKQGGILLVNQELSDYGLTPFAPNAPAPPSPTALYEQGLDYVLLSDQREVNLTFDPNPDWVKDHLDLALDQQQEVDLTSATKPDLEAGDPEDPTSRVAFAAYRSDQPIILSASAAIWHS